MPGVSVEAELQPAGWRDGAMRLIVHVGRKPFGARLTLAEGSRTSAQALMAFDSQAQTRFAEQLSARVLLPPGDDEAHYYRLDYSQYLDAEGSRLLLSASRFRSEPRTFVPLDDGENLRQRWDSERLAIGVSQALIVKPDEWLDVVGQFYTTADHVDWRTADPARQDDSDTYARAVSFEGDWRKVEDGRLRRVSAGVHQGLICSALAVTAPAMWISCACACLVCSAMRWRVTGRVWCPARCTGAATTCPTANACCSVASTSAAATRPTRPQVTRGGDWPTSWTTASTATALGYGCCSPIWRSMPPGRGRTGAT